MAVAIFGKLTTDYRYSNIGRNLELQILLAAAEEKLVRGLELNEIESPLLLKYRELAGKNKSAGIEQDPETNHALTMILFAEHAQQQGFTSGSRPMFKHIYERLELLSRDFLDREQLSGR